MQSNFDTGLIEFNQIEKVNFVSMKDFYTLSLLNLKLFDLYECYDDI